MRYRLRALLIVVACFLFGLGLALALDRSYYTKPSGTWPITKILRFPREIITWIFILGDSGSEGERRFWEVTIGTILYSSIALCVAALCRRPSVQKALVQ